MADVVLNIRCNIASESPVVEFVIREDFGPDIANCKMDYIQAAFISDQLSHLLSMIKPE